MVAHFGSWEVGWLGHWVFKWFDDLVVNEILDIVLKANATISFMTRLLVINTMLIRVKVGAIWWLRGLVSRGLRYPCLTNVAKA